MNSWKPNFLQKVSLKEKFFFFEMFSNLVEGGISISKSIDIIEEKIKSKYFLQVLESIKEDINQGINLSSAMQKFPNVFSESDIGVLQAGEQSGKLEDVMQKIAIDIEKEMQLKSKIIGSMIYPAVIILALFIVMFVMFFVVIPSMKNIFDDLGVDYPYSLKLISDFQAFCMNNYLLVLFVVVILVGGFIYFIKTEKGKYIWDSFLLKIPFINEIVKKYSLVKFFRSLALLLDSGIELKKVLEIAYLSLRNEVYRKALINLSENILKGEKISASLATYPALFSGDITSLLLIGEKTANLGEYCNKISDIYEKDLDRSITNFTRIIEPAVILVMGIVVGVVAYIILNSIFSITEYL